MAFGYTPPYKKNPLYTAGMNIPGPASGPPGSSLPPTGSYDPALDAQQRAAERGLSYLTADTARDQERAGVDYGLDRGDLIRDRDRGYQDLDRDYGRGTHDLDTSYARGTYDLDLARGRGTEDYGSQIAGLQRAYSQLQRRQGEGARHAGVLSGGIALMAARKRAENQAIERQPIDTSYNRFLADNSMSRGRMTEDYGTDRSRLTEDYGTGRTRLGEDADSALGRLDLGYQRGTADRGTVLSRAGEGNAFFGLDLGEQRMYQATQAGWVPPRLRKRN